MPLLDTTSAKPMAALGACFTRAEEDRGRAWAFVASPHGGMFTDFGAHGAAASYWLRVRETGSGTRVRLIAAAPGDALVPIVQVVERCR